MPTFVLYHSSQSVSGSLAFRVVQVVVVPNVPGETFPSSSSAVVMMQTTENTNSNDVLISRFDKSGENQVG